MYRERLQKKIAMEAFEHGQNNGKINQKRELVPKLSQERRDHTEIWKITSIKLNRGYGTGSHLALLCSDNTDCNCS